MINTKFYTYVYFDSRPEKNWEPIYVGKGKKNRSSVHLKHCENKILSRKIKKKKELGLTPRIEIYEVESEDKAFSLEIQLITKYGRITLGTGTLCNLTNGGEGTSGIFLHVKKHSEEMHHFKSQ